MLNNIHLKNFLSHEDTTITLSEGVNVFVGNNGAGKSSVIDAITYALYGKHERGNNSNIVRRDSKNDGSVELEFITKGKRFSVFRRFNNTGSLVDSSLKGHNTLVAGERSNEGITDKIRSILELDYEDIKIATIIKQGELDSIIDLKPREVKELINRFIGLDNLDKAYEKLRDIIDEFNDKVKREYGYDVRDLERVEKELKDNISKERDLKLKLEDLRSNLRDKERTKEELREKIDKLENIKRRYEEYLERKKELERYLDRVKTKYNEEYRTKSSILTEGYKFLSIIKDKEPVEKRYNMILELEKRYRRRKELEDIRKRLDKDIANDKREIDEVEKKIANYSSLKEPEYKKDKIQSDLDAITGELEGVNKNKDNIESKLEDYRIIKEHGICPTCDSRVSAYDIDNKINNKNRELEDLLEKKSILLNNKRKLEDLLEKSNRYENNKNILKELEERLSSINHNYKKRVDEYNEISKELEVYQDIEYIDEGEKESLMKRIREINRAEGWLKASNISREEDLERLKDYLDNLKDILDKLNKINKIEVRDLAIDDHTRDIINKIIELEEDVRYYNPKAYEDIIKEYKRLEEEIGRLIYEKGNIESSLTTTSKEIKELSCIKDVLIKTEKYLEFYNQVREDIYHKKLPSKLREWAFKEISRLSSEYLRIFDMSISNLQIKEEKNNVIIECYNRAESLNIQSMSGGEKVAISLALRVAIASLKGKYNTDFIILDEPTTHLDQERKGALVRLITKLAGEQGLIRQIIIITHDSEIFEDADVDNIIKFKKVGSVSRIESSLN